MFLEGNYALPDADLGLRWFGSHPGPFLLPRVYASASSGRQEWPRFRLVWWGFRSGSVARLLILHPSLEGCFGGKTCFGAFGMLNDMKKPMNAAGYTTFRVNRGSEMFVLTGFSRVKVTLNLTRI